MSKRFTNEAAQKFHDRREALERASCKACVEKRLHTSEENKNHPYRGSCALLEPGRGETINPKTGSIRKPLPRFRPPKKPRR